MSIFSTGTKNVNGNCFSNGGRVLNFTSLGKNFINIQKIIINSIKRLNWKYGFRKDIGWRIIILTRIISGKFKGKKFQFLGSD